MAADHADASGRRSSAAHVFVAPEDLDAAGVVALSPETEHHLTRVLRLRDGERVSATDGAARWRWCVVANARGSMRLEPVGDVITEPRHTGTLTVATALPKGDRLDWLVQKATELGVDHLQLLHAQRSVVRWKPERFVKQLDRLRRISDEAARQSRRVWRVDISAPVDAAEVLPVGVVAEPGGRPITAADALIVVGPEGGWAPEELALAEQSVSLGPNVLRTETAVLAAIALSVAVRH